MPHFKSIIFYQNSSKLKLFLQKNAKLLSAGGSAPRPPKRAPHCEFLATGQEDKLYSGPEDRNDLRVKRSLTLLDKEVILSFD